MAWANLRGEASAWAGMRATGGPAGLRACGPVGLRGCGAAGVRGGGALPLVYVLAGGGVADGVRRGRKTRTALSSQQGSCI